MSGELSVRVQRLRPGARLPVRATPGASGFDLHACLEAPLEVGATPVLVPTGIALEAPFGVDMQVRPRSGLSRLGILCTFGTIDADYRGEVLVTLYTIGSDTRHTVQNGDRIAQLVCARLAEVSLDEVAALSDTERGAGGHGSTGR